jgi:hypothetical protein
VELDFKNVRGNSRLPQTKKSSKLHNPNFILEQSNISDFSSTSEERLPLNQTAIMADVVSSSLSTPPQPPTDQIRNAMSQEVTQERKARKSVAFSEGTTIVDENGAVTMKADGHDDTATTAQSHSPSTPPLSQALGDFTDPPIEALDDEPAKDDEDDVANMLKGMKKKKKSKTPKPEDGEAEGGEAAAEDGGLDLSSMKKKKKSKKPKEGTEDEFAAKLAALDIEGKEEEGESAVVAEKKPVDDGDMEKGTGIWQHDCTTRIPYESLSPDFSPFSHKRTQTTHRAAREVTRSHLLSVCVKATRRRSSPILRRSASV